MGGPDSPPPRLIIPNQKLADPTSPPCQKKSEIGLSPFPPLWEIIFCHTLIYKTKYTFQKDSVCSCMCNLWKRKKNTFEIIVVVKVFNILRKIVLILSILHAYSHLVKNEICLTPPITFSEKNQKLADFPPPPPRGLRSYVNGLLLPLYQDQIYKSFQILGTLRYWQFSLQMLMKFS